MGKKRPKRSNDKELTIKLITSIISLIAALIGLINRLIENLK